MSALRHLPDDSEAVVAIGGRLVRVDGEGDGLLFVHQSRSHRDVFRSHREATSTGFVPYFD